jgi:phosphohistidine phosphatase
VDVLVVRHAVALDKDEAKELGVVDADRPLTKEGQRRMKRVARGLARTVPNLSALYSSPWRRAVETADLVRARFKGLRSVESDALLPQAAPEALVQLFASSPAATQVAVVGHEPHLSSWVSWCLTDGQRQLVELRKGGACLLRFEDTAGPSRGKLLWLMTPSVLRQL